jgi:signal transduction histidine kinase
MRRAGDYVRSVRRPPVSALTDPLLGLVLGAYSVWEITTLDLSAHEAAVAHGYAVLVCGALGVRRTRPVAATAVAVAAVVGTIVLTGPPQVLGIGLAVFLLLPYAVASRLDRREALYAVGSIAGAGLLLDLSADGGPDAASLVLDQLFIIGAAVAGGAVRRARHREIQASRLSEARVQEAVDDERRRIARELHDIVGHGMSVMIVQADAARHEIEGTAPGVERSLTTIQDVGRESLIELRRLLGLLRDDTEDSELRPPPGFDDIGGLVESFRNAGMRVELAVDGGQRLSPSLGLTVYRVVQESLTNTLRHTERARARVHVEITETEVRIQVSDNGRAAEPAPDGRGLLGMRERVRVYGGQCTAGPTSDGWMVSVRLPLTARTLT